MRSHFDATAPTAANHVALTPLPFLTRAAEVHAEDTAVAYGDIRRSWAETARRVRAVAGGPNAHGIGTGNTVMKGCCKDSAATDAAFRGGRFQSGAAAVVYPDGYIQIRDCLKDVIISGGENVSSVEVEATLDRHPDVQAAAVVARPDEKWGETRCAIVELRPGATPDADGIIAFCRSHLAGFKTPKTVVFTHIPKTATGKVQKFVLRARAKELG